VDWSVNVTWRRAVPEVGAPMNAATGGTSLISPVILIIAVVWAATAENNIRMAHRNTG
jgi:hypothetical protein